MWEIDSVSVAREGMWGGLYLTKIYLSLFSDSLGFSVFGCVYSSRMAVLHIKWGVGQSISIVVSIAATRRQVAHEMQSKSFRCICEILTWWRCETDGVQLEQIALLFQINICWNWKATIHISIFFIYITRSAVLLLFLTCIKVIYMVLLLQAIATFLEILKPFTLEESL